MKFARRGFLKRSGLAALGASGFPANLGFAKSAAKANQRGIAMTIGLNRISPSAYPGAPELRGCLNDATAINEIARFAGFECAEPLLNEQATAKAIIDGIQKAARDLKSGDIFLIQVYVKISDVLGDTARDEERIKASVLLISGCQDNQVSGDLNNNGLFTGKLLDVWADGKFNQGKFRPNYRSFHGEIVSRMPQTQTPSFYPTGEPNLAFWMQKPFTI
jgi:hypothetical protein